MRAMTAEIGTMLLAGLAGGVLGVLFFGGLWWTVRKATSAAHPALWIAPSALIRMLVTLGGFYLAAGADWQRMLACTAGFILARQLVLRWTREEDHATQP